MKTSPARSACLALCLLACSARAAEDRPLPRPGDIPAVPFGITRDGDPVEAKQFAGKVVIVTFWASWCGPCLKELPLLEGIQQITHDYDKSSREAYGVNGIPHMLIIGRDGRIQRVHRGYSEEGVDRIVAEINAALAAS